MVLILSGTFCFTLRFFSVKSAHQVRYNGVTLASWRLPKASATRRFVQMPDHANAQNDDNNNSSLLWNFNSKFHMHLVCGYGQRSIYF